VLADAIARYKRYAGFDVYFMTGTDEHGEKIQQQAEAAGKTPKQHVDEIAGEVKRIWDIMNTSYDKFIRTTDDYHEKTVQKIFKRLYDQGDIYLGNYEGWYCTPCESFWTETQAKDGVCPDCGRPVKKATEEAYFFKLGKYTDKLIKHIEEHPEFIQPESRKNEMLNNFLRPGVPDLCVSRTSFNWGVQVNFDPKHVVYVWIDALSNYITGIGYGQEDDSLFKKYWPANVHLIGKDILRFHTIYWPCMLMALDLPLPKQIFGHPWLLNGTDKMSKSLGNTIYADDLVNEFGVDATRYYVLREMPFAQDGSITYETLINRTNADLANVLGNLVNRTIAMINKYFDGTVSNKNVSEEMDKDLIDVVLNAPKAVDKKMDELRVADALEEIWTLFRRSNKYIDETEPWVICKDEAKKDRLETVLYNLVESIRIGATLLSAYLPGTADKIFDQLQIDKKYMSKDYVDKFNVLEGAHKVTDKPEPLFARIDFDKKLKELEEKMQAKIAEAQKDNKEEKKEDKMITIDDFDKVEMKIGEILKCEKVEGSDKLLKSQVKIGEETRQIVSGIAKWYSPDDMVGKKVVVVTNLKPAKLKGELSEGMIIAAEDSQGNVKVIECDIESGSEVR
ncbi:MAG: methionine--tRNA ligase, partial [Clostridia bacterium]|nr:methionine--tRNA ligase [Clostridia bacterium]